MLGSKIKRIPLPGIEPVTDFPGLRACGDLKGDLIKQSTMKFEYIPTTHPSHLVESQRAEIWH